jgi:hypothetical protein
MSASTKSKTTAEVFSVEVKIGVQQAAREVVLESTLTPEDVVALVSSAVADGSALVLGDDKGRTVLIPGDKIAYVEIGAGERGRIGFGTPS